MVLGIKIIPSDVQPPLQYTQDVYQDLYISQEFTSLLPNLTDIGMSIKNPNLKDQNDITLSLYDQNGQLVRTSKLNGLNIGDGAFVKFQFSPIIDSLNQRYSFTIMSPSSYPEDLFELFYTDDKPSWIGQMQFNGKNVVGGLSFVTFHQPVSKIGLIKSIYSDFISRFLHLHSQKSI